MRLLAPLLTGLLLLTCAVPAMAKPTPPPPIPIPELAHTCGLVDALCTNEAWITKWEGPDLDAVKNDLAAPPIVLLIQFDAIANDRTLKPADKRVWVTANFCPAFDPAATLTALDTLIHDHETWVDQVVKPKGGKGNQKPLANNGLLRGYAGRQRFSHNPCDTDEIGK